MNNTWDDMPKQETGTSLPADEACANTQESAQTSEPEAAAQPAAQDIEASSSAPEEPQKPQHENSVYGSYSSYDAHTAQQPYGGDYRTQNAYPADDGYKSPYSPQQSYTPNTSQPYGSAYNSQPQYQPPYYQYPPTIQPPMNPQPPKKNRAGKVIFIVLLCGAIISALIGIGASLNIGSSRKPQTLNTTTTTTADNRTEGKTNATGDESINIDPTPAGSNEGAAANGKMSPEDVYEKLSKSNVGIVLYSANGNNIMGQGSGIIMSQSGYILTCAHVIDGAGSNVKIRAVLEDNTEYDATIVGYDSRTDIGVIKISPTSALSVAEFGDSNALRVGEQIIAIGNPGGLQFFGSFSDGKVSAIDRPVNSSIGYTMKCVQHTAAISPGNSGGLLANMYGQVIGINSSKIAQTDYEGIGFAIPISSAKPIIDDLIQHGYVTDRAKLGITYNRINANYRYYMTAYSYGMPTGSLVIESIGSDSDLKNYDVQVYDFITAVNGKELQDGSELTEAIENCKPGDEIELTISRITNNTIETFNITCKLVQDKGSAAVQAEPESREDSGQNSGNPFGGNPFGDDSPFSNFPF